jgi:hypothetical protein
MRSLHFLFAAQLAAASACGGGDKSVQTPIEPPPSQGEPVGAAITIHPSTTFQTIVGWEATSQAGQIECKSWDLYKQELLPRVVNEAGINRIRLEVKSGFENPVDWYDEMVAGKITMAEWKSHRYTIVNDNADPNVMATGGFHFGELDHTIDQVVNPIRQLLAARGEKLYVNLNYVDFKATPFEHKTNPAEYAEFMLAMFQHIRSRYGWAPDAVEVILEPDNTQWTGTDIGRVIVAAGDRLKGAGFSPDFIAPSTTNMATSLPYIDAVAAVPRVSEYLTDLAYHRYSGVSKSTLQTIAQRAASLNLRTAMLEHIGSGYQDLHDDLLIGRNSAWQQFTLAYCETNDNGGRLYDVNESNPAKPTLTFSSRARFLRQYFLFVRAGAVRVDASSGSDGLSPLAFRNTNGGYAVVVKANGAAQFHVDALPAGTYGVTYTTDSQSGVEVADVVVGAGGFLNASIPAAGVITIHRR